MQDTLWQKFYELLDNVLKSTLDKNIIIFGSSRSGEFIRWFYKQFYDKDIKAIIDRWKVENHSLVLHLMSLYYIYDENDLIINTFPVKKGPEAEFNEIGEDWSKILYTKEQIIELWDYLYKGNEADKYEITFYDWLEYSKGIDILSTVRRSQVKGKEAHGYYPTDFRLLYSIFSNIKISDNDAVLDIGCGKGSTMLALKECGFKRIGGVEYTDDIYRIMIDNIKKCNVKYEQRMIETKDVFDDCLMYCYLGDATLINEQLDLYNYFFLFNPFSYSLTTLVIDNIIKSLNRKPRRIKVIYAEPIYHNELLLSGKFKVFYKIKNNNTFSECFGGITYDIYIYESI